MELTLTQRVKEILLFNFNKKSKVFLMFWALFGFLKTLLLVWMKIVLKFFSSLGARGCTPNQPSPLHFFKWQLNCYHHRALQTS